MDKHQLSAKDKLFKPRRQDPYQHDEKASGHVLCTDCGAYYNNARWSWAAPEAKAEWSTGHCPACRRIKDGAAAAAIDVIGEFSAAERQELLAVIRNTAAKEKAEHPLERILKVDEGDGRLRIETTGEHVARRISHALCDSLDGKAEYHYDDHHRHLRVRWQR